MLLAAERSTLLVIDLQQKMVPALADGATVVANACWLIGVARRLGVPVAAVAQYPQGLGPPVPEIAQLLAAGATAAKNHFSCVAAACLPGLPGAERAQFVLAGAEAHVCVLQSALDLVAGGREVFVVADAVGSRRAFDRDVALARMRQEGVRVVTREMVAFEWLREAGTPLFRDVNREFLK